MLEEGSFRGRTADFVFMFLMGGTAMCVSFLLMFINFCLILNRAKILTSNASAFELELDSNKLTEFEFKKGKFNVKFCLIIFSF